MVLHLITRQYALKLVRSSKVCRKKKNMKVKIFTLFHTDLTDRAQIMCLTEWIACRRNFVRLRRRRNCHNVSQRSTNLFISNAMPVQDENVKAKRTHYSKPNQTTKDRHFYCAIWINWKCQPTFQQHIIILENNRRNQGSLEIWNFFLVSTLFLLCQFF